MSLTRKLNKFKMYVEGKELENILLQMEIFMKDFLKMRCLTMNQENTPGLREMFMKDHLSMEKETDME
jgi:hypothetical protein